MTRVAGKFLHLLDKLKEKDSLTGEERIALETVAEMTPSHHSIGSLMREYETLRGEKPDMTWTSLSRHDVPSIIETAKEVLEHHRTLAEGAGAGRPR